MVDSGAVRAPCEGCEVCEEAEYLSGRLLRAGTKLAKAQDRNAKQKQRLGELEAAHRRAKDNLRRVTEERDALKAAIRRALERPHPAAFGRLQKALYEVTGSTPNRGEFETWRCPECTAQRHRRKLEGQTVIVADPVCRPCDVKMEVVE